MILSYSGAKSEDLEDREFESNQLGITIEHRPMRTLTAKASISWDKNDYIGKEAGSEQWKGGLSFESSPLRDNLLSLYLQVENIKSKYEDQSQGKGTRFEISPKWEYQPSERISIMLAFKHIKNIAKEKGPGESDWLDKEYENNRILGQVLINF